MKLKNLEKKNPAPTPLFREKAGWYGARILILGFGKEGRDNFLFFRKIFPKKVLGIGDRQEISNFKFQISNLLRKDKYVKLHLGKDYLKAIKNYDIVVKSPGIPIHLPEIEKAYKEGKITSQTQIFFENCPGKIIGVTGTKGKSTTTALIYRVLKTGGFKVHLVGNIGNPVLNFLLSATKKDIYVYELSSHQLYNLKKSPQIAVFLNLFPEHLDYYQNFNEYLRAKQNITRYQKKEDYFIFNPKNEKVKATAKITKAKKIPIKTEIVKKFVKSKDIPLIGNFYFLNIAAAIEIGKLFKIQKEKIKKAIKDFKPLKHRLELVGTFKGITFYNDSLSTIPETTILALDSLGDKVQTIFLGGSDRGLDFKNLAKRILKSGIKTLILFPTTGDKIWKEIVSLKKNHKLKAIVVQNMRDGVKLAYQYTKKGKICLLSCASPSFSLFKDYKEKGNLFKKYVREYGQSKKSS